MKPYKIIKLNYDTIKIYRYYEKKLNQYRYSYEIITLTGSNISCGFGINNQITHPTYESILNAALKTLNLPIETIRDYKLKQLLNNETIQN